MACAVVLLWASYRARLSAAAFGVPRDPASGAQAATRQLQGRLGMPGPVRSEVRVRHRQGVLLDELAVRFDRIAHHSVVIGPPIETLGRDPRELNAETQAWIEGKMREISAAYEAL